MVEQYAEELDYEIKMMEANLKFSFIGDQKEKFEMFRSKDIQGIIYKKLTNAISLQELRKKGVLIRDFNLHDLMALSEIELKFTNTSNW